MSTEELINQLNKEFDKELQILTNEISKEISNIQKDSEVLAQNQTLFKIKNGNYIYNFVWQKIIFELPLPKFSMKRYKWSLDIPEVTMSLKEICFDWPKTTMVNKKVGEKPETTCAWKIAWRLGIKTKFWDCTIRWTPIIISVPEITMETKCISTKIPEIRMKTKEFSIDVPEVAMENKKIIFNSLVITSINYAESEENIDNANQKINQIQQEINELTLAYEKKMQNAQVVLLNEKYDEAEKILLQNIQPDIQKLETSIAVCKNTITELKNHGAIEQLKLEEANLNKLINDLKFILQPYEQALIEINKQRMMALKYYNLEMTI